MRARTGGLRELFLRIGGQPAAPRRAHCANCGITIDGDDDEPSARSSSGGDATSSYCCDGCADGGPCVC